MIHFFCALPCEAEPIIQRFKLSASKQFDLFRIYQSKDSQISLTTTGIGKLNAASAVSYHHACLNTSTDDIWLNIGVAGHASIAIGEMRLIHKITDHQDNACWYPQILFTPTCESAPLMTLTQPSTDYQDALFDMEASGFYQMAIRLGTAELIHCLKIISDNHQQPTSTVTANDVKDLINAQLTSIEQVIDSLNPIAFEMTSVNSVPEHYSPILKQWHFTQSEQFQLLRLLRQWTIRLPDLDAMNALKDLKTGKSVLSELKNKITESDFVIYD